MGWDVDRRTFVGGMGALAAAGIAGPAVARNGKPYNVLMNVTDQELSIASYPEGLHEKLPAHSEMPERGLLVENYHIQTTTWTSSRSPTFQGHHTQPKGASPKQ